MFVQHQFEDKVNNKMKYQLPTLKTYMVGLFVLTMIAIVVSTLLPAIGVEDKNIFITIIVGMLIGHLVGTTVSERPTNSSSTNESASSELKTIYVGNLAFTASKSDLYDLFKPYGKVHSSRVMFDRITRKSRGFGFVEMNSDAAEAAIEELDGADFSGRSIKVNEATNQSPQYRRYLAR